MNIRNALKRAGALAFAAGTAAALAVTGAAGAASAEEIPDFDFSKCPAVPDWAQVAGSFCFQAVVVGGGFKLGDLSDEIKKPITLTYASFREKPPSRKNRVVFGNLDADAFKARDGIFNDPLTEVWAQPKYAGKFEIPPDRDFKIELDMKIRLTRPFLLGPHCEIGKENKPHPLELKLTTGTTNPPPPNEPITGKRPELVDREPPVIVRKATHVDNAFEVPGARGCFLDGGIVNGIVNSQAGLPSEAGHNEMIMNEFIGQIRYADL